LDANFRVRGEQSRESIFFWEIKMESHLNGGDEGCEWDEDRVVVTAIAYLQAEGWNLIYQTRELIRGAVGGVDAILMQTNPVRFCFLDGKGKCKTKEKRSMAANNLLGTVLKRIKVAGRGYLTNETARLFQPPSRYNAYKELLHEHAILDKCQYILAVPQEFQRTLADSLEVALRRMLHIRVLIVGDNVVELGDP
jgi:hypothetical protein